MKQSPTLSRKQRCAHWGFFAGALALAGWLSATVVPESELEANKPQLGQTTIGANFIIDWETQPDVYYFVEGSPDLTNWLPAKLLKDNAESGSLSLGTVINLSKAFYRLSLVGDPGAARMRADDDGDGIINLLEVEAGWDAFEAPVSVDSEPDGLPDYWEQFYFGTLEHDGSYIAVEGGVTLAEAYAAGTDPRNVDSDGDGWTDAQELAWGWDVNYDQSRDSLAYSASGDSNNDGISNAMAVLNGLTPTDEQPANLPQPPQYAVIDIGTELEFQYLSGDGYVNTVESSTGSELGYVWHLGTKHSYDPFQFNHHQMTADGTLFGINQNPELDENEAVVGLQYPVPVSCGYEGNNYTGDYVTATLTFGDEELVTLKPDIGLLYDNVCSFSPEYAQKIAVSSGGGYVAGFAAVDTTPGEQDRFFYTAEVSGDAMGTIQKYPQSDAYSIRKLLINDEGDFLYGYTDSPSSTTKYKFNGNTLSVDHVYDLDADGRILASVGGNTVLVEDSSNTILFEGEYAVGFSDDEGRLTVLTSEVLYIQKLDDATGNPVTIDGVGSFVLYPLSDIYNSAEWENQYAQSISEGGKFVTATAQRDGIDHLVLLGRVHELVLYNGI